MVKIEKITVLRERSILFGDNTWGMIADEKPEHKRGKHWFKYFLIVPDPNLRRMYPELQQQEELEIDTQLGRAVWREYPTTYINDKDTSRTNAIVRIYCGFDGRDTEETRRVKRYTDEIKHLNEDLNSAFARIAYLTEERDELVEPERKKAKRFNEINRFMKSGKTDDDTVED